MKYLLCLFLFLLPWQTIWMVQERFIHGAKWEYGTIGFYATEVMLWLAVILFIGWYWKKRKEKLLTEKWQLSSDRIFLLAILSFVGYTYLSSLWAIDIELALQQALHALEACLLFFMLWLGPLSREKAAQALLAGAILPSLLGIWQFLNQSTFAFSWLGLAIHPADLAGTSIIAGADIGRWLRAYGSFSHPNVFGGYLVIVFLLVSFVFLRQGRLPRLIYVAMPFLTAALFFTFSRSAWLAWVVGLFVLILCERSYLKQKIYSFAPCLLLVGMLTWIFFPLVTIRVQAAEAHEAQSVAERVSGYRQALALWRQHPWQGVGAGNYTAAVIYDNSAAPGFAYQPVHNVGLLFLTEMGIFGFVFFVGMWLAFFLQLCALAARLPVASAGLILAMFDHYIWSSYIGLMISAVFLAIIFGVVPSLSTDDPRFVHAGAV